MDTADSRTPPRSEQTPVAPAAPRPERVAGPARVSSVSLVNAPRLIWLTMGAVVLLLIVVLLLAKALTALVLVFIAIIIGEAIRPLVIKLERRRVPRPLAILLILLGALVVIGVLVWLLVSPLLVQLGALANNVPAYVARIQQGATQLQQSMHANRQLEQFIQSLSTNLASALQQLIPTLISIPITILSGAFSLLINVVVVLTMTIFWLSSSVKLKAFVVSLFPPQDQEHTSSVISEVAIALGGYVRGVIIAMVLIGALTALGLTLLGVPYALLLGLLAGLTELIPYLGPWISGGISVLVALVAVDPLKAFEVFILFNIIQQVEGNLVEPLVMSKAVHVDPLLVIVAILIGVELMGVVGAILAVPVTATIQVVVARVIAPAIRRVASRSTPAPADDTALGPPVSTPVPSSSDPPRASAATP